MTRYNQRFGGWGEQTAAQYLEQRGYRIVARNYRTPYGELDLVVEKEGQLVFVEVKTRSSQEFGMPEDAITEKKRAHILQSAFHYIQENGLEESEWRVDVISIIRAAGQSEPEVTWFENALV